MWYAKMYFSGEKEFFENDAFLESLLTFLELDEKEITPMLERISVNWERFVESRDREAYTAAMVELGVLAEKHIYLRLLYTRCYSCRLRSFWNVCWTWIPPAANRRSRRRKTTITTSREIRNCSDLSRSR